MKIQNEHSSITLHLNRRLVMAVFKFLLLVIILILLIEILPYSSTILIPLLLAILLSFLLNPLVIFLERYGLTRLAAVSIVMTLFLLIICLAGIFLYPIVVREVKTFTQMINNQSPEVLLAKLKALLIRSIPFLKRPEIANKVSAKLEEYVYDLINQSINFLPNIFSIVIVLVLIPFITFFLLKDAPRLKKEFIELVPNRYFEMTLNLIYKIDQQLGSYIRSQLVVSFLIGTLSIIALYFFDVPYFLFIGVIAGLANMIPYFGPITGAGLAVIVNFFDKGTLGSVLVVIIAFAVIRLIDDTIISPNILARSVEIHPLLVIFVIFLSGNMFGILGLLFCIPVTGIINVTVRELIWSFKNYRLMG